MRLYLLFFLFLSPSWLFSQQMLESSEWCAVQRKLNPTILSVPDGRSDSIDILHTRIWLDVVNPPLLIGRCDLQLKTKVNGINTITLDLEALTVDSVRWNGASLGFSQSPTQFQVFFPDNLNEAETGELSVYYKGTPVTDASGWGGVYNQSGYFYNLGVGFDADPHSFGRAWFPCFDNFVERSTFETTVVSAFNRPAYCNGNLEESVVTGPQVMRRWKMEQAIPSYLACFATGPYVSFKRSYPGELGLIPVEIATVAADTNKVASTFQHLPQAIAAFENWYGPYRWNKIGYSVVPFNSGAMEHATNIALMKPAVDGTLNYETLWAHELSHHWWGDLATCTTAEDMWLNEGWAVFSEHLFTEWVYGKPAYQNAVGANFLDVLSKAHVQEGGYRAVTGIPHELTYGKHVYNKGAVVAHNLRGYLGDSLFKTGIRTVLNQTQFDDWSSAELRDKLSAATGQNLDDFFEDWVFAPGFTHFSVDSFQQIVQNAQVQVQVNLKQKLRGAPHFYQQVPVELTLLRASGAREYRTFWLSGQTSQVNFELPQSADPLVDIWVNTQQNLTFARIDKEKTFTGTGSQSFSPARMDVKVNTFVDTFLLRVENNYVRPDTAGLANPFGYKLSNRSWNVRGNMPLGTDATFTIFYDGRGILDQLDTELFAQTSISEDSIVPLYRPGPGYPWTIFTSYVKNALGSTNDRYGQLRLDHAIPGEYTIAKGAQTSSVTGLVKNLIDLKISPNPAQDRLFIESSTPIYLVQIIDKQGKRIQEWPLDNTQKSTLSIHPIPPGLYFLVAWGDQGIGTSKLLITH